MRAALTELQSIADQRALVDIARGKLSRAVGLTADTSLDVVPLPDPQPQQEQKQDIAQLIGQAQKLRADLYAKQAEMEQRNALEVRAARSASPKLKFNGDEE